MCNKYYFKLKVIIIKRIEDLLLSLLNYIHNVLITNLIQGFNHHSIYSYRGIVIKKAGNCQKY